MSEEKKSVITHAIVNDGNETSYDFDIAVDRGNEEKYSAKDILTKVIEYMETTPFLYIGGPTSENEDGPANKHIGIWLDTTVKQPTRQYTTIQKENN